MKLAGIIHDVYDDTSASVLAGVVQSGSPLHEKVAGLRLLDASELEALPDRVFAMVGTVEGQTVRKYAMHDEGHLRTSLLYFAQSAGSLPIATAVKVAQNLLVGCDWYDVPPPADVEKLAGLVNRAMNTVVGVTGAMDVADNASKLPGHVGGALQAARAAQLSGVKAASAELHYSDEEVRKIENSQDLPKDVEILDTALRLKTRKHTKKADVPAHAMSRSGTLPEVPLSGPRTDARRTNKVSHVGDISAEAALPTYTRKVATRSVGGLPLDEVAQVKRAAAWLDTHAAELTPQDRRVYAEAIAISGDELGEKVAGDMISKYAGMEYGDYIYTEIRARVSAFEGTEKEAAYAACLEKVASSPPGALAQELYDLDVANNVDLVWNRSIMGFRDPYRAVYEKASADESYSWSSGTDYTSSMLLQRLAQEYQLEKVFDKDLAESFKKDPVGIFKSLPDPQKTVLARLASQQHNGMI